MAATIRHRLGWLFRRSTSPAERQMESFRASQLALARATAKNRPSTV
jgi:hypothetical protein